MSMHGNGNITLTSPTNIVYIITILTDFPIGESASSQASKDRNRKNLTCELMFAGKKLNGTEVASLMDWNRI